MSKPVITACICSLDRADGLSTAFRSLIEQQVDKAVIELLIVDNGSTAHDPQVVGDELVAEAKAAGFEASWVVEHKIGLANARNCALKHATGEWIAFIDDDETADTFWLQSLLSTIGNDDTDKLACLGGPMKLCWPGNSVPSWFSPPLAGYFSGLDLGSEERDLDPRETLLFGGNLVVKREAVLTLGGFSVSLGRSGHESLLGSEDTLVQLALADEGYRIRYLPDAIVEHVVLPERTEPDWVVKRGFGQGFSDTRLRKIRFGHGRIRQAISAFRDWYRRYRRLKSLMNGGSEKQWSAEQLRMQRNVHDAILKGTIKALVFDR